jgi:ATP-dependent Lon protease
MLVLTEGALEEMIDYYTRESGVRNLERRLADLARRAARRFVEDDTLRSIKVSAENLSEFLGPRKLIPEHISDEDEIGVVNGLAYTESGGDVLKVEVAVLEGSGKLELTGSLGDVMKESARIALSLARSMAAEYGIDTDFYKNKDIHIHFPEGAIPKDGPSAGVTMLTALISALSGTPVRRDVAMTGEISLRGRVLAIGGLKEKTMAALSYGVRDVLIPEDNMKNLDDLDRAVIDGLNFIPCSSVADVLRHALVRPLSANAAQRKEEGAQISFDGAHVSAEHPVGARCDKA